MTWVGFDECVFNLDHFWKIEKLASGAFIGRTQEGETEDLPYLQLILVGARVIPSNPGFYLLRFWPEEEQVEFGYLDTGNPTREPIIGWGVSGDGEGVFPITVEGGMHATSYFTSEPSHGRKEWIAVLNPNGLVSDPMTALHSSVDEWVAACKREPRRKPESVEGGET